VGTKDLPRIFDAIEKILNELRGIEGVPLSYVIREKIFPAPETDDPAGDYYSLNDEMIPRALILKPTVRAVTDPNQLTTLAKDRIQWSDMFKAANLMVYNDLHLMLSDSELWPYIRLMAKIKNGLGIWECLKLHYSVPDHVDHRATQLETDLKSLTWLVDKRTWILE